MIRNTVSCCHLEDNAFIKPDMRRPYSADLNSAQSMALQKRVYQGRPLQPSIAVDKSDPRKWCVLPQIFTDHSSVLRLMTRDP